MIYDFSFFLERAGRSVRLPPVVLEVASISSRCRVVAALYAPNPSPHVETGEGVSQTWATAQVGRTDLLLNKYVQVALTRYNYFVLISISLRNLVNECSTKRTITLVP